MTTATDAQHATRRLLDGKDQLAEGAIVLDSLITDALTSGARTRASLLQSVKSCMGSTLHAIEDAADVMRRGVAE